MTMEEFRALLQQDLDNVKKFTTLRESVKAYIAARNQRIADLLANPEIPEDVRTSMTDLLAGEEENFRQITDAITESTPAAGQG